MGEVEQAQLLRAPEQKVAREQLGDRDPELKGLAEEPVLDLGPTPVEGGSPAQRGLQALSSVMEAVADHILTRAAHGGVYELGLTCGSSWRTAASAARSAWRPCGSRRSGGSWSELR